MSFLKWWSPKKSIMATLVIALSVLISPTLALIRSTTCYIHRCSSEVLCWTTSSWFEYTTYQSSFFIFSLYFLSLLFSSKNIDEK